MSLLDSIWRDVEDLLGIAEESEPAPSQSGPAAPEPSDDRPWFEMILGDDEPSQGAPSLELPAPEESRAVPGEPCEPGPDLFEPQEEAESHSEAESAMAFEEPPQEESEEAPAPGAAAVPPPAPRQATAMAPRNADEVAEVFGHGNRALTRQEAVAALTSPPYNWPKSSAYHVLQGKGRFSGLIESGPDGLFRWKA